VSDLGVHRTRSGKTNEELLSKVSTARPCRDGSEILAWLKSSWVPHAIICKRTETPSHEPLHHDTSFDKQMLRKSSVL
jgi:hypothetical protein